jgi:ribosome production factor 2
MAENNKATTHKGRLHLESLQPKVNEDPKASLIINTKSSSEILRMVMTDLHIMRREYSKKLGKKNELLGSFEEPKNLEFLCERNNTPLFCYTSDSKKRPMNLVMGSLFNNRVLDMFEWEITNYIPISHFSKDIREVDSCMKPVIIFQGDVFENDFQYERMKKFLADFFKIYDVEDVNVSDLRRVLVISASDDKEIKIRQFQVEEFNEYNFNSNLQISEIGPSLNLKSRRIHLANEELYKLSLKQPKQLFKKKEKNIETNALGEKRGRIHMARQNVKTMALKKYKKILGRKKKMGTDKEVKEGKEGKPLKPSKAKNVKKTQKGMEEFS